MRDGRLRPRIKTPVVMTSMLVMLLSRLGSFNALEQTKSCFYWKKEGSTAPSADTIGDAIELLDLAAVRPALKQVYSRLKRNKALKPLFPKGGFTLIVDGHESSSSYKQCCCGCLHRKVETGSGTEVQFYHRHVMAILLCRDFVLLLDLEMQRPGEDEVATAIRLLERLFIDYPRAFDTVLADGLYARAPFFNVVKSHGKEVTAVLKDDRRDLYQDAISLFPQEHSVVFERDGVLYECWDLEGFTSWPQVGGAVRVVRSLETRTVRPRMTGSQESRSSSWMWVSTTSRERVGTEQFVTTGHRRWAIENEAFNELVTEWHADHVYKHAPTAIEACWLMTMLAYNLFQAFFHMNLKEVVRSKHSQKHFAQLIASELYFDPKSSSP